MPDRVIVPSSVPKPYRHVCMQVGEKQDPESIRDSFLREAETDIRKCGQSGNELINQALPHLNPLSGNSLLSEIVNWGEEHAYLENLTLNTRGDRRHLHCAAEALRQVMIRIERGEKLDNLEAEVHRERLIAILNTNIADVGLGDKHTQTSKLEWLHEVAAVRELIREAPIDQLRRPKALSTEDSLYVDISKL